MERISFLFPYDRTQLNLKLDTECLLIRVINCKVRYPLKSFFFKVQGLKVVKNNIVCPTESNFLGISLLGNEIFLMQIY